MRYASLAATVLWLGACGGTAEQGSGGAATGSATGSSGAGGASDGAGTGGTGGIPTGCTDPAAKACTGAGQCVLTSPNCCLCGMPELPDFVALNATHSSECVCEGPACGCATFDNPNLAASCESGSCAAWDVRQEDAYSGCTADADCRLRLGLGCCELCQGGSESLIAVRTDAEQGLKTALCAPSENCSKCAPQYPANASAQCMNGHCAVVLAN